MDQGLIDSALHPYETWYNFLSLNLPLPFLRFSVHACQLMSPSNTPFSRERFKRILKQSEHVC